MALSPEARERAEEIFFDLLEAGEPVDDEVILAQCGGDTAMAAEVIELMAASTEAQSILPSPESRAVEAAGDIGPYRIIGELGRGGMGTVHLAERTDDYEMEVAIKVLPPGLAGTAARERFVAERRILARLQHPGIARLLDGGWTADGRPYIVMERVDGMPISEYVAGADVNGRLELFLQVADAVQYAHRHLVVHRDLKPSNILVSREGRVKLLDFGIAKLLDDDPSSESLTRTGERLLTPDYASPEQIRGEAVTTASDVYQLGVVLYEMLCGVLPFRLKGRPLVEVERTVSDTIPKPPSLRVTETETDGKRTARALRGDLDNIIMKALRKEPEARYASPEAMANDVRRHLQGLPVEARGNTALYVAKKFVRRHRTAVLAAGLLLVSVLSFAAVSVRQAALIAQERDRVAQERDIARRVQSFMEELFEQARPDNDPDREMTVRDVLNVGAFRIRTELEETPATRAAFMNVIGSAYGVIGDRVEGEKLLREALAIRTELDENGLDAAETMNDLGVVELRAQRLPEADSLLTRALAIRIEKGAEDSETATTQLNLAVVRERQRRFEEAEGLYEAALPVFKRRFGPNHRNWAVATNNLANLKRTMGSRTEAESLLVDLLPAVRRLSERMPVPLALTLTNLGTLEHERQDHESAVVHLAEAVSILEQEPGSRPTEASARQNLAAALGAMGEYEEAEREFRSALAARESMYPANDFRIATVRNNLATMWRRAGDPARAEPEFREAVRIARSNPRVGWRTRAQLEVNWAWTLMLLERYEEASTVFNGLLSAAREGEGISDRIVFDAHWGLARTLAGLGRITPAEAQFRTASAAADSLFPQNDARRWQVQVGLGSLLAGVPARSNEGLVLLRTAADSLEGRVEEDDPFLTEARERLGVKLD